MKKIRIKILLLLTTIGHTASYAPQEAPQTIKPAPVAATITDMDTIKPKHPDALVSKYAVKADDKDARKQQKSRYTELSRKLLKSMTEQELREYINVCVALKYYEEALKALEQLILVTKNTTVAKEARIEIADLYFEKGDWKTAGEKYNEFVKLYPADKYIDYAQYKSVVSFNYCLPTYDRDQKMTEEVIGMTENLLKKEHPFKDDIAQIRTYCYNKVYQHNADIFNQYLKKGSYAAAETRLSYIKTTFTTAQLQDIEVRTLTLDYKLACAQNDTIKATGIEQKLAGIQGSGFVKLASSSSKKSYVQFF